MLTNSEVKAVYMYKAKEERGDTAVMQRVGAVA